MTDNLNGVGISLYQSHNNTLSDNLATLNDRNIFLSWSDYNRVFNNTATSCTDAAGRGIHLNYAHHTLIIDNDIFNNPENLYFYQSRNATVRGNTLINGDFHVDETNGLTNRRHYFDLSNTLDGKPIYYYLNEIRLQPENFTNAAQVFLVNCSKSLVSSLNISGAYIAVDLYSSHNNTLSGNTLFSNIESGVRLGSSDNNTLSNNTIFTHSGGPGIHLYYSDNNTVAANNITGNAYGIHLEQSQLNMISGNEMTKSNNYNIYLDNSDHNNITSNNATYARFNHGIYVSSSDDNTISLNNLSYNDDYGIRVSGTSADNLIWRNIFEGNVIAQADYIASGTGNRFDNGILGNYWGDYLTLYPSASHNGIVWNEFYEIDTLFDRFPLVNPFGLNLAAQASILNPILPNPNNNGIINLTWSAVSGLPKYYIYRNLSEITSIDLLTPIAVVLETNYTDNLTTNGIYYYIIVAGDDYVNCSISNCVNVTVEFPTEDGGIPGFKLFFTTISLIAINIIYLRRKKFYF